MRKRVRDVNSAQYMLARGGRNAMFQTDLDALSEIIKDQFDFLAEVWRGSTGRQFECESDQSPIGALYGIIHACT